MIRHIEKLREKPDHIKKKIAFFTSLSFSIFIFIIWTITYKVNKADINDIAIKTPINSLTSNISISVDYIKDMFVGSNKNIYEAKVETIKGKR